MPEDYMNISDDIEVKLDDPQASAGNTLEISVQELQQIKDFLVEFKSTPEEEIEDLYDEANRMFAILNQYI